MNIENPQAYLPIFGKFSAMQCRIAPTANHCGDQLRLRSSKGSKEKFISFIKGGYYGQTLSTTAAYQGTRG